MTGGRRGWIVLAAAALAGGAAAFPAPAAADTLWLCRPGLKPDPCRPGLTTTVFSPGGTKLRVTRPRAARPRPVDCFYVYPTVSDVPGPHAPLRIDPELRSVALYQAARYSQYCRVYAPVYRQLSLGASTVRRAQARPSPTGTCARPGAPTCAATTGAAAWCW